MVNEKILFEEDEDLTEMNKAYIRREVERISKAIEDNIDRLVVESLSMESLHSILDKASSEVWRRGSKVAFSHPEGVVIRGR